MMPNNLFLYLNTFILFLRTTSSSLSSTVETAARNCPEDVEKYVEMCEADRLTALHAVKEIFDQEQNCVPRPKYSQKELARTKGRLEHAERTSRVMAKGELLFFSRCTYNNETKESEI